MNEEHNKLLGIERCILLQALAESYLKKTTGKNFNEAYPNIVEEYGVLLEQHIELLKAHLKEEFLFMNLDLNECIVKNGEEIASFGKMTKYEFDALLRIVDTFMFIYSAAEDRKKKFKKNN